MLFVLFVSLFVYGVRGYSYQDDISRGRVFNNSDVSSSNVTLMEEPLTLTPLGSVRGSWLQTRRGRRFQAYRGLRYAEPPVGELRFQPPKPIERYWSEVDARADGPACPQPAPPGSAPGVIDEDCLRLNVYTPDNNSYRRLPVIVFIHPGGFYSFSGRSEVFGPLYLLDRDLVLVTINYRLGSLGFIATGDAEAPGNNGYKDQVAALRWVRQNIASFGGDPDSVTIAGCSAGSFSVALHMISPMSRGLFHRAISVSGAPTSKVRLPDNLRALAVRQAELVGCPTTSSRAILACLKTKPWQELGNSLNGFFEFGFDPIGLWLPIVEPDFGQERFLPVDPFDAYREGRFQAVPYLITMTRNEFFAQAFMVLNNATLLRTMDQQWDRIAPISFLLPRENSQVATYWLRQAYFNGRRLGNDSVTARSLGRLYGDGVTAFPVHRLANLMCRNSPQPVYYGEFDYIGNSSYYLDPITRRPTGVTHQDDLQYIFSQPFLFPIIPLGSRDDQIVNKMTAIWYNFARSGDPNPREDTPELQGLFWPKITPKERQYVRINQDFSIHRNLFEEYFQIWDEIYPLQYTYRKEYLPYELSSKVLESLGYPPRLPENDRYVWDEVYPLIHLEGVGEKIDSFRNKLSNEVVFKKDNQKKSD